MFSSFSDTEQPPSAPESVEIPKTDQTLICPVVLFGAFDLRENPGRFCLRPHPSQSAYFQRHPVFEIDLGTVVVDSPLF